MTASPADLLAAAAWKLQRSGQLPEAIRIYRQAIAIKPDYAEVHNNLGNALSDAGLFEEAVASFRRAAKLKPNVATVYTNLGLALAGMNRFEEAEASHRRALKLQPDLVLAHNNLGIALQEQGRLDEAAAAFNRALELSPNFPEAHCNLGNALGRMDRLQEAAACYRRAIELKQDFVQAYCNLANVLGKLKHYDEAIANCRRALELQPDLAEAVTKYHHLKRIVCDWEDIERAKQAFIEAAQSDQRASLAFPFLSIADDPALQMEMSRHESRTLIRTGLPVLWQGQQYRHEKIRLAYLSADFHEHATAYLMAGLFEQHDRAKFDVYAFSFGPDDGSPMRRRLTQGIDHFIDVARSSDHDVAQRIRNAEIDIAVDLKGHTTDARPGILAFRPAPIQAQYIGYPGTMGADFIDYIIVDPFVVPADQQPYFTEKLVHLPDCYQVNDAHREIAQRAIVRADYGLPKEGFVFCSFNNNYKITPEVFAIWMRLLKAVPGSVLWLFLDNEWVQQNLRREAEARGMDATRLIFAPRMPLSDHLARHRLADLFLDTSPYNAHTTASDALWVGLPLVTCAGRSFPSRVAGSLLHAVGLPELVTNSLGDYEELALRLATQPDLLQSVRAKLERNRLTAPLFDMERSRRHIESAYTQMWSRWQRGEKPAAFAVES
jgi:protein O-GlcNAc transferase